MGGGGEGAGGGRLPWVHLWARRPATARAFCRPKLAPTREALTWCPPWLGEGLFGASVGLGSPLSLDAGCRSGREAWGWRVLPAVGQHLWSTFGYCSPGQAHGMWGWVSYQAVPGASSRPGHTAVTLRFSAIPVLLAPPVLPQPQVTWLTFVPMVPEDTAAEGWQEEPRPWFC